jgi:hypothetical protein
MKEISIRVLAESILIVFSVLLAFWIDKETEQSGNTKLKTDLYERLYTNIQNDSADFSLFLSNRKNAEQSINILIRDIDEDHITKEGLALLFADIEWFPSYRSNNSTYSSILNSGQLKLFEKDTLFINISSYYSQNDDVIDLTQAYAAGSNRFLVPYLNDHFDRRLFIPNQKHSVKSIDLDKFKSREFYNLLYCIRDRLVNEGYLLTHHKKQIRLLRQMRAYI